jgi:hypothetical protein
VIQVVAITDDRSTPAPPLRAVACGELTAICAPAVEESAGAEALWRHEELVESLMETRTLLPVRFGTLLADDDAVAHAVGQRGGQLAGRLELVRGAVELALRVDDRGTVTPIRSDAATGTEYMQRQAGRVRSGQLIHAELATLARDTATLPGPELVRAAYLVERDKVDDFVARVRKLQDANPELVLVCTGPWPPYSFAEGERA